MSTMTCLANGDGEGRSIVDHRSSGCLQRKDVNVGYDLERNHCVFPGDPCLSSRTRHRSNISFLSTLVQETKIDFTRFTGKRS